ncbi:hypothetical protein HZZ00_19130 [Streptomyces sp. NEAU-sy36]|uniref:hypothetical protein n=1 Tax=unclassified Streptomyces TaxID=2593676 RepID=UPI0015D61F99|nr:MULTISPECIES: hypothetical protein [unclassified Streptomyces]QLJ02834.1 hypothetical protein HZZ00_18665 [Streptomyces sp. NEAU-sy36]QLJ02909.1 hypothetical protein HZZ00_19130 [Streptomyces sp. NEAU-sy36]
MTLAALCNFLSDCLSNITAGLVLALGGTAVKKLCTKQTTSHHQDHTDEDQPTDQ